MKYIVVTGGVVSGLGKGVTISSIGKLLQACGLTVTAIKIDPYLNVDAGTMSPFEHGEVFVLQDGGESDLDLGNYERFLNITLTSNHNITTGKVYRQVIFQERQGLYLGKTVQVVPHITDAIQEWIQRVAHIPVEIPTSQVYREGCSGYHKTPAQQREADVCLIEVGGTVGDIESMVFLEALRQMSWKLGSQNFVLCFVSLVPLVQDEQKTKPTQHGIRDLRSLGLSPSVLFCRCAQELSVGTRHKIAHFCHVVPDHVLSVHDVKNVYHVPILLQQQQLHGILKQCLQLDKLPNPDLSAWSLMAHDIDTFPKTVQIALIGKYTGLQDSYLSVIKALKHAAIACQHQLELHWVEAAELMTSQDSAAWLKVKQAHGVVVPGGFGKRGFDGKVLAAQYCRENRIPFLGVCLGFQAMVVDYARNVLNWPTATSTEFIEQPQQQEKQGSNDNDKELDTKQEAVAPCDAKAQQQEEQNKNTTNSDIVPVVIFMPEIDKTTMGGTMRLGSRITKFTEEAASKSKLHALYGQAPTIQERHRHRYEVNPDFVQDLEQAGLLFTGRDEETGNRMEIAELVAHPYYVGTQYHPEFQSRPMFPSPPFLGLVMSACGMLEEHLETLKKQEPNGFP